VCQSNIARIKIIVRSRILVCLQNGKMRQRDMARHFAEILQKQRKAKSVSQELLAERADCDSTMISLIERKIRNPTLNLADSLANGLGIPLSQMIKEAEDLKQKRRAAKQKPL
jgi:ribosome-binding protein aMBF1 (putative translation factor)